MAEIDDLTIQFEDDGFIVVKELDKAILSKGAWATVMYLYQEWDNKAEDYGAQKITLRRYQKQKGQYRQKSKFNISSKAQGERIHEVLTGWLPEMPDKKKKTKTKS